MRQPIKLVCQRRAREQHNPKLENSTWPLCAKRVSKGLLVVLRGCRSRRACWVQQRSRWHSGNRGVSRALGSGHRPLGACSTQSPALPLAFASSKHVLERSSLLTGAVSLPVTPYTPFGFFPRGTVTALCLAWVINPSKHTAALSTSTAPAVLTGHTILPLYLTTDWINYRENTAHGQRSRKLHLAEMTQRCHVTNKPTSHTRHLQCSAEGQKPLFLAQPCLTRPLQTHRKP